MTRYLPLGSVVLLEGGEKRIMIYGRRQQATVDGTMWDYVACLYPEGHLDDEHTLLFNHEQIERVFFLGYQETDEFEFQVALQAVRAEDAT